MKKAHEQIDAEENRKSSQNEACDCEDCQNNPMRACHHDCDLDEMCAGCKENREAAEDREFDEKCAMGCI